MCRDYKESIERGISFLKTRQLPSGEFATYTAKKANMDDCSYVKSPFFTTFILHSLSFLKEAGDINKSVKKAVNFLVTEKENKYYWRFFGRGSYIPPDLDDTCCALSALFINRVKLDYEAISNSLLKYQNTKGTFCTWILDPDLINNWYILFDPIDYVVNTNILFFYSLIGKPIPQIVNYLYSVVKRKIFHNGSYYYDSPFSSIYCLTRTYADGNAKDLQPALPVIKKYLLEKCNAMESRRDPLKNAKVAVSLINIGFRGRELDKAIFNLINAQESDGGWPITSFFSWHKLEFYGSRELNTAFALEALQKYQNQ